MLRSYLSCHYFCLTRFVLYLVTSRGRSSASGSKNHRTALYRRQADFAAAGFCVSKILRREADY